MERYVKLCAECAVSTTLKQLRTGKLHPLSVPLRPWSHIAVNFVTDLPHSEGKTVIMVVERFSKSCRFLPLPNIPTAFQTAKALLTYIFRHYSLRHPIRPWVTIHLAGIASTLCPTQGKRQSCIGISPTIKRVSRMHHLRAEPLSPPIRL